MSYFPGDIPFMSKEELRENGIKIPKDATDTNVGDMISRKQAIEAVNSLIYPSSLVDVKRKLVDLPPAQQNLSEEYAKAVRNWLVNYQIKCAELNGRYTPYEVIGWIVSDWRKENGIW